MLPGRIWSSTADGLRGSPDRAKGSLVKLEMPLDQLSGYIARPAAAFFPVANPPVAGNFAPYVSRALARLEFCFSRVRNKYYRREGQVYFDPQHSDQYAMFLYWVGNEVCRTEGDPRLGRLTYLLNKALHGIDLYFEVELPDIFCLEHPVGTVLGRARYANYFFAGQRCTVGGSLDLQYPALNEGVAMMAGSSVIGNCRIGTNAWLSANSMIMNENLPDHTIAFGQSPHLVKKITRRTVSEFFFREP